MATQTAYNDRNFREYYRTDRYKGFYKCQETHHPASRMTHVVFSNGETKIFANGLFAEDAMAKAFIAIDQYHRREERSMPTPVKTHFRLKSVTV